MRRLIIALSTLAISSASWAFTPVVGENYNVAKINTWKFNDVSFNPQPGLTFSEQLVTKTREVDYHCGLVGSAGSYAGVDCFAKGDKVKFVADGRYWRMTTVKKKMVVTRDGFSFNYMLKDITCYLQASSPINLSGLLINRPLKWDCSGAGSRFGFKTVSDGVLIKAVGIRPGGGDCGLRVEASVWDFDTTTLKDEDGKAIDGGDASSLQRLITDCSRTWAEPLQITETANVYYNAYQPENRADGCSTPVEIGNEAEWFDAACDTHDRCYYAYWTDKNTCDQMFYRDMLAICDQRFGSKPGTLFYCERAADIYFDAVLIDGEHHGSQMLEDMYKASRTDETTYNAIDLSQDVSAK